MKKINFEVLLSSWESFAALYQEVYASSELKSMMDRWHISHRNGMWEAYISVSIIVRHAHGEYFINRDQVSLMNIQKAATIVAAKRKAYRAEKSNPDAIKVDAVPVAIKPSTPKVKKEPKTKMSKKVDIHRTDGVIVDLTLRECKVKLEDNGFVVLPKPNKGESYEVTSDKKTLARINAKIKLQKKLEAYQKLMQEIVTLFNKIQ